MATESVDITSLRDEDVLRRMWQETEDLSRKKEIRAHLYKLREQRLKEFYTTGEVLLDVQRATPQTHESVIESSEEFFDNSSLIPVSAAATPAKPIMTHTDSIKDRGFMTMKSQEIRDSNHHQVFQDRNGASDGQSYWKVESSSESYQAVGRDGQYEVTSQSQSRNMAGENGRIVMDSGYATENKSVVDRNGDTRLISSRAYDTSGRDISGQQLKGSEMNLRREIGFDGFNDGDIRYTEDGGRAISRSTADSRTSESRTSSSSHTSQKWSTDVKTSSSRITSSSTTTREGSYNSGNDAYYVEKYEESDGKSLQPFDTGSQAPRRGTTEVKKTIIRNGKVITETTTYIDGKPVGSSKTTTTTRDVPPETVTVIRGGKLIKETVPSKTTTTEKQTTSTTTDSKGSVQSFITTEKFTSGSQQGGHTETVIRSGHHESDVPYDHTPNQKPHQGQTPPQTKTVIRGGKVIRERIPSDVDETKDFIRRESSAVEKINSTAQSKRDSINRSSTVTETRTRTSEVRGDQRRYDVTDDEYVDYVDHHEPEGSRQRHPDQSTGSPGQDKFSDVDDDVHDKRRSTDHRTTTTKTITVIRGGKVMKQTVVEVDGKQISDTGKPSQPYDDNVDRRPSPLRDADGKWQPRDEPDEDVKNETRDSQVTVKTIKTVIRGGKLIKEAVPANDDVDEYGDVPEDENQRSGKPRKGSPGIDRPGKTDAKPTSKKDRPEDEHPNNRVKTPKTPQREVSPDDTVRVVKGSKTDVRKTTSQKTQHHATEVKTVSVIRGGKIVKEKVTVTDDEETERRRSKSPETDARSPQKVGPATTDADNNNKRPKKLSPEPGGKVDKKYQPDVRHPEHDLPSDIEGSEYPSGSEAPDQEEEMPYKVVTVIRSGKLIKECVPISDDDVDDSDGRRSKTPKSIPSKGSPKDQVKPSDIHPVQGIPSTDRKKPTDKDQPGRGKKPNDESPGQVQTQVKKPDTKKKGEKPSDSPHGRHSSPSAPQDSEDDHVDHERRQDQRKPTPQRSSPGQDRPEDGEPRRKSPGKEGKKSPKPSSELIETDTDERHVKTMTVIRGGKVITETVKMTEEEIRERKLMEGKSTKKTVRENVDFIEGEKPKGKPKSKPEDDDDEDDNVRTKDKPRGSKSPTPKIKPENLKEREFIEREKSAGLKTVTVIRSGKIVKEVVPADDDEGDDEPRQKPSSKPGKQKPKKTDRSSPDKMGERPDRDHSDDDKRTREKHPRGHVPDDDDDDDDRSPVKTSPDKSGRRPQDEKPDEYGIRPQDSHPSRTSPDKSGKHPKEGSPGKVGQVGKKPKDEPDRRSPDKTGRRPGEDFPASKRTEVEEPEQFSPGKRMDEPGRHSPDKMGRGPDEDYPESRRPHDGKPGKPSSRPEDEPGRQSPDHRRTGPQSPDRRPQDGHPVRFSPTTGRRPEDEVKRQPSDLRPGDDSRKPREGQPDRFSPTTGRQRDDEPLRQPDEPRDSHSIKFSPTTGRKPDDELKRPEESSRKPRDGQPDRFSPTTGRKPDEELKRQPSDVRPDDDGRRPHSGRSDESNRQPVDIHPDSQHPEKPKYHTDREFIDNEKSSTTKTVTVIRAGKIIRETAPVDDDDEPHPEPHTKERPRYDQPEDEREKPQGKRTTPSHVGKIYEDEQPDDRSPPQTGRRPEGGKPGDDLPGRRPRDGEPNELDQRPQDGKPYLTRPEDEPDRRSPDKMGRSPTDLRPESKKPGDKHPSKPDKRPQDDVGRDGKRHVDDQPDRSYPDKTGRRPGDEPDRRSPDKLGRRPEDDYITDDRPDQYCRRPEPGQPGRPGSRPEEEYPFGRRPQDDHLEGSPGKQPGQDHLNEYERRCPEGLPGRRPFDEPDRVSPEKMGKFPGESCPEGTTRKPKDGKPDDFFPNQYGRRPEDDHPGSFYPDERRPHDDRPDQFIPDKPSDGYPRGKSPDTSPRYPGDYQPNEYDDRPSDGYPREPDRRPHDGYPDDRSKRPQTDKPYQTSPDKTGKRPKDGSPDKLKRRPSDIHPQRVTPGKRPDSQPDRRHPTDKRAPTEPTRPAPKTSPTTPKAKKPMDEPTDDIHWTLTSDKISVDVSASHAQFASSLRAPPLDRPETPTRPFDDDHHSQKSIPSTRSVTPKQITRTPSRDSTSKPRDKHPFSTPVKGTPQRPKSPWTEEPQYTTTGRKPRRDDSPTRIIQRPSSKISDVISRLTCDTQSSKERRKLTSRQSRSNITKRTRTPGVSPSTSPTRGRPKSGEPRKRTTSSGSTSTLSTEQDSDFNYKRPESEVQRDTELIHFIRTERDHSRKVQRVQGVSPEEDEYPITSGKPRDRSPGESSDASWPRPQNHTETGYPRDRDQPTDRKPSQDFTRPRKPANEYDDNDDYDTPRKKKPSDVPEDDRHHPLRRPSSTPKSPMSVRPRSPSEKDKPRDRSPRSGSGSPGRKNRSPQRTLHPETPDKTRKPRAPEKTTPLQKGLSDRPRKELTEFPSQKRFPPKEKVPLVDKTKPKSPGTRPGDKPGTPTHRRPDLSTPKPESIKPWQRPQNGVPLKSDTTKYPRSTPTGLNKGPETPKKPKTPTSLQPEKPKGKPGTPANLVSGSKKPVGRTPSTDKMPKGRRPSEDGDLRKLHDFVATTRRQTTTTTSKTVETRNFINSESGRRPTSKKNIMDYEWNEGVVPNDASSVSSQENLSPTGKPKGRPNDKIRPCSPQGTRPGSTQPGKTPKSPLDRPKATTKDQQPAYGKPVPKNKYPKRTGSESSENESDVDVPMDAELIHGDGKPQKLKDHKYREQIDLIRREQETNYSTKVVTSVRDSTHEEFTGKVEMPDSSRESTRSPDVNRLKCVPVNERDTEELRPRYADQVSEPEDEPEHGRRKPDRRPVEEESKKTLRDILVKTTLEKIDRIPDLCDVGDVTDETINVSVAERVNKFMETALKPTGTHSSRPEDITLKGLDDTINEFIQTNEFGDDVTDVQRRKGTPTSVIKAKTMFETIANQTVVTGTAKRDLQRQDDILNRPSVLGRKSPRPEDSGRYPDNNRRPRKPQDHDRESPSRQPGQKPKEDYFGKRPERSPDRYVSPTRKTSDRPSGSPDRYGTSPKRPGDRSPDRYDSYSRRPIDQSPDRYDKSPRRHSGRPDDHSPDRYISPTRKTTGSPDRYVSPTRKTTGSPDRYGTSPKRPGDHSPERYATSPTRPSDRSPDRYGKTPGKRDSHSPDRYSSVPRKPGDRDAPKKYPEDKASSPKPAKHTSPLKDKPKAKTPTPDRNGSLPGSLAKKPKEGTPRRPNDIFTTRDSYPGNKSPYPTPGREPMNKVPSPDRYGTRPSRTAQTPDDRHSPTYTTSRRSPDSYRPSDRDRSPRSKYSPTRSPYERDTSPPHRPTTYGTPEPVSKKSPSKELADQIRRLSAPNSSKPETTRYPNSKDLTRPQKPTGVVDKYSLMDYDNRRTSTTKYTTSHTIPLFPTRTSPERKSKPLFDTKPKTNGFHAPDDDSLSPTFEKAKKIPDNSTLKAPALLKKQNSQPDNLRYTTSIYQTVQANYDGYPTARKPSTADTTKVNKFGVSLKKTTPGTSYVRKGPVDVGKKETELDRTYDLDLLNAMLERAKGYEERRLIRGQIRTVKTMIENDELTQVTDRRRSYGIDDDDDDDENESFRPKTKAPISGSPLSSRNGYETYKTTTTTITTKETGSIRTTSPDKHYPREDSPGRYTTIKSTATLTLSPKSDTPLRRSPDRPSSDRRSPDKSYPRNSYSNDFERPGAKKYSPDREPVGTLVDSETRKLLKRSGSPRKGSPSRPGAYSVSKTIKKSHTEHETKETNLTDSIISSYGVGPTDEKGRPLFGLQALRRQKGKQHPEPADFPPKEPDSPLEIRDSSGRAFFGLRALKAPKKESNPSPESPTLKDLIPKYESHSIGSPRRRSLRGSPLEDDDDDDYEGQFLRKETNEEDVNRMMGEPGQSLKEMIRKHERFMEDDDDDDDRRTDKTKTTSSSYSTSTVIRSSAVRRPDGTVSVRKNVVRGETTAKNDEEPQTRVTTEEYSYETPREPLDDVDDGTDDKYRRRSLKSVTGRSSTNESLQDKYRSTVTSSSLKTTRKSPSPDRQQLSSFHRPSSNRPYVDDYPDGKGSAPRQSIADRLTQLSKKFSNDSLDKSLSNKRDVTSDNNHTNYTSSSISKSSTAYRSTVDGTSPLTKPSFENGTNERRYSSTPRDDDGCRRGSSTPIEDVKETLYRKFSGSEEVEHTLSNFPRVGKGGSVKALSQKFQQAAADAESPKSGVSSYPKAGLILRSTSFKQTNGELTCPDSPGLKQSVSMEVRVGSPGRSGVTVTDYPAMGGEGGGRWSPGGSADSCDRRILTQTTTETRSDSTGTRSFLGNSSKVTGVQDIISRMRAADQETNVNDTANDSEARALLNKFLGASVMMSGMEPLVKASGGNSSTLVSQVERQRILGDSPSSRDGYREIVTTRTTTTTESRRSSDNIDDIWDEKKLRQLLDACEDYEGRRKLRARLRTVMAEKSACEDLVAAVREETRDANREVVHPQGESLLPYLEQLRTTLKQGPRSRGSPPTESGNLCPPHLEDSGTESGEDFRLLAGLRESIREHEVHRDEEDGTLLAQIRDNLKTLQTTLDSRLAVGKTLDSETRDGLIDLVARLQDSLKMTAKPLEETKSTGKNRFVNKRHSRQNRHTVGVTKKELEDARRLLEENRYSVIVPDSEPPSHNEIEANVVDEGVPDPQPNFPSSHALHKQSSVGDLINNPLYKPFRSVKFDPYKATVASALSNATAKPFPTSLDSPPAENDWSQSHGVQPSNEPFRGEFSDLNSVRGNLTQCEIGPAEKMGKLSRQHPENNWTKPIENGNWSRGSFERPDNGTMVKHTSEDNKKDSGRCRLSVDSDLASSDDDATNDSYSESDDEKITVKQPFQRDTKPSESGIQVYDPVVINGHAVGVGKETEMPGSTPPTAKITRINNVERRIQEIQNENRHQARQGGKTIEELQKAYRERKEMELERRRVKAQDSDRAGQTGHDHWTNLPTASNQRKNNDGPCHVALKPGDLMDGSQTESELSMSSTTSTESGVSHAQKLLQMATDEHHYGKNYCNKSGKRAKMKRSNTVDIPKPHNYYPLEGDTDYSDDDQRAFGHKAAVPPQLEPKTESDRRFIAFLAKQSQPIVSNAIWRKDRHPSANQETSLSTADQWENRFSRIKTAFEKPKRQATGEKAELGSGTGGPRGGVRAFGKTPYDSVLWSKGECYAGSDGSVLAREGNKFLRKMPEGSEAQEKQAKLPWANPANENGLVVGSLTVAPQKQHQEFAHVSKLSTGVNQFRHAPMSAFKPVQKKTPVMERRKSSLEPSLPIHRPSVFPAQFLESAQENRNPILPWIKDQGSSHRDNSINSALAKFEDLSGPKQQAIVPYQIYSNSVIPGLLQKSPSQPALATAKTDFSLFSPDAPSSTVNHPCRLPIDASHYGAPSVKKKVQNIQNSLPVQPVDVKYPSSTETKKDKFKPITTYSVDVAATSTVYNKRRDSPVENSFYPAYHPEMNASTPEEHVAVTKIMGSANQQQAVTVRQKTQWRDDSGEPVPEPRSSAVRNLTNTFQRFSSPSEQFSKILPPTKPSPTSSHSPLIPPNLPTGKTSPFPSPGHKSPTCQPDRTPPRSMSRRTSSAESLVTPTRSEDLKQNGDALLTSRLQIPYRMPSSQSSPRDLSPGERRSRSPDPLSSIQRSESCHQLAAQSKPRRPQSLYVPNPSDSFNPPVSPPRRSPNPLAKTKSSHALGFGGSSFEASFVNRASIEIKQKTVEEFLSQQKSPGAKKKQTPVKPANVLELDDSLDNVDEAFDALFTSTIGPDPKHRTSTKQLTKSMSAASFDPNRTNADVTSKTDSLGSSSRVTSRTTTSTTTTTTSTSSTNKPISPFAKFQQLDRQNSSSAPSSPSAGKAPLFTFTDPKLCRSASGAKDRLLQWCQFKTKEYKNIQIENFSTSWSNGLAFCALIHHFRPEAFDYECLSPKERRKNFELAFRVAEEQANIAPLLDVEDMVMMKKPDWKCVFTYVQSIYHRFKNEEI